MSKTINRVVTDAIKMNGKSNAVMLSALVKTMHHLVNSRDWSPMARLFMGVDAKMQRQMAKIVSKSFMGLSGKTDETAEFGYRFTLKKEAFGPTNLLGGFSELADQNLSIYGSAVSDLLGEGHDDKRDFVLESSALSLIQRALKSGATMADIKDAIDGS